MLVTAVSLLAALLFCGLVVLIMAVIAHNRLHSLMDRCGNAFRQLDRHLEQRSELVAQRVAACGPESGEQRGRWESMAGQCQAADTARQAAAERFGDAACMAEWIRAEQACEDALSSAQDADATRAEPQLARDWSDAWRSTTGKIAFCAKRSMTSLSNTTRPATSSQRGCSQRVCDSLRCH